MTLNDIHSGALDEIELEGDLFEERVPTGLRDLDEVLEGGFRRGTVTLLAAPPAAGKSMLALQVARTVAIRDGKTALIHSLREDEADVMQRVLAAEASVPTRTLIQGAADDAQAARLREHHSLIDASSLYVDSTVGQDLDYIARSVGCLARIEDEDLRLVVVDFAQMLTHSMPEEPLAQQLDQVGVRLWLLAKSWDVAIVLISSMGASPEDRGDLRPLFSDLGPAGSLMTIADCVIFMQQLGGNESRISVVKRRNGRTGSAAVRFEPEFARFADLPAAS